MTKVKRELSDGVTIPLLTIVTGIQENQTIMDVIKIVHVSGLGLDSNGMIKIVT